MTNPDYLSDNSEDEAIDMEAFRNGVADMVISDVTERIFDGLSTEDRVKALGAVGIDTVARIEEVISTSNHRLMGRAHFATPEQIRETSPYMRLQDMQGLIGDDDV